MLRRPFCGMAAGFLLGIWTAAYGGRKLLALEVFALFIFGVRLFFRRAHRQTAFRILLCALTLVLGSGRYDAERAFRETYLPYLKDGMQLSVQGELAAKQIKNNQYIYELKSCVIGLYQKELSKTVPVCCNRILVYSDSDAYSIGEILVLEGKIKLWESAVNEGNFDAKSFYEARKTDFKMVDVSVCSVHGKKDCLREGLWELRLRLKRVYQRTMDEENAGILITMVLGDKELLEAETKRLYQIGGLSHILAISGLHISVLGMSLYCFLRKRGIGLYAAGVMAAGCLWAYGNMAGMGTSIRRSVIMFVLLLVGQAVGRSYDTLNSLGIAAVILLWDNPFLLWDAGFLFSFTAIIGVVWVGQSVEFGKGRMERFLGNLFVSAAIQLTTLPFAAWYYYEIPSYALCLNLLVLPFMGLLLGLGVVGGTAGLFSEQLAAGLLFPCEKILALSNLLCGFCAELPGAMQIVGRPRLWQMCVYYILLVLFTLRACHRKREIKDCRVSVKKTGKGSVKMLSAGCVLLAVLCFPFRGGFELAMLDVGQGDACFLRTGDDCSVFVDGGSSDVGNVGEYRILPFLKYKGTRKIDYWFVSHTDHDHISGLEELLAAGYRIRHLVMADGIVEDDVYASLVKLAERAGTEILYMGAGDVLQLGKAKISVLAPVRGAYYGDKNEASLVFLYEEEAFSGIFTGDIGTSGERKLLRCWTGNSDKNMPDEVDFYKAAHHGSKHSNSEAFLQALSPAVSVVSCGAGNRYGHPGAEAVAHMEDAGSEVLYTMEAGQITLSLEGEKLIVRKYRKPGETRKRK